MDENVGDYERRGLKTIDGLMEFIIIAKILVYIAVWSPGSITSF